jgi:hypothetical protein
MVGMGEEGLDSQPFFFWLNLARWLKAIPKWLK